MILRLVALSKRKRWKFISRRSNRFHSECTVCPLHQRLLRLPFSHYEGLHSFPLSYPGKRMPWLQLHIQKPGQNHQFCYSSKGQESVGHAKEQLNLVSKLHGLSMKHYRLLPISWKQNPILNRPTNHASGFFHRRQNMVSVSSIWPAGLP